MQSMFRSSGVLFRPRIGTPRVRRLGGHGAGLRAARGGRGPQPHRPCRLLVGGNLNITGQNGTDTEELAAWPCRETCRSRWGTGHGFRHCRCIAHRRRK